MVYMLNHIRRHSRPRRIRPPSHLLLHRLLAPELRAREKLHTRHTRRPCLLEDGEAAGNLGGGGEVFEEVAESAAVFHGGGGALGVEGEHLGYVSSTDKKKEIEGSGENAGLN